MRLRGLKFPRGEWGRDRIVALEIPSIWDADVLRQYRLLRNELVDDDEGDEIEFTELPTDPQFQPTKSADDPGDGVHAPTAEERAEEQLTAAGVDVLVAAL